MPQLASLSPAATLTCASAAVAVTGALFGGLFGLFEGAAQQPWLMPTPEALHMVARCEAESDRQARNACVVRVAQAVQARDLREARERRSTRLAKR
jgi:hypothetical protein